MVIMGGAGPMGLCAIDYLIHNPRRPSTLVVTGRDAHKLRRAERLYSPAEAQKQGVTLIYLCTPNNANAEHTARELLAIHGDKYDDIFVMAASEALLTAADAILAKDGCLNFFAGPIDPHFSAPFNFYNVHYNFTHVTTNSGGNTDDMKQALRLIADGRITPASLITHIGGLNCVPHTTKNLPRLPGSKKLIYTHKNLPLTAIADFAQQGAEQRSPFFADLARITKANNDMWSVEAEQYILRHAEDISVP